MVTRAEKQFKGSPLAPDLSRPIQNQGEMNSVTFEFEQGEGGRIVNMCQIPERTPDPPLTQHTRVIPAQVKLPGV